MRGGRLAVCLRSSQCDEQTDDRTTNTTPLVLLVSIFNSGYKTSQTHAHLHAGVFADHLHEAFADRVGEFGVAGCLKPDAEPDGLHAHCSLLVVQTVQHSLHMYTSHKRANT